MSTYFDQVKYGAIDVVKKGPYNNQKPTSECTLQCLNTNDRELIMKKVKNQSLKISLGDSNVKVVYTRSKRQKARNYYLYKALEMIKEDSKTKGRKATIDWNMPVRKVKIDDNAVFEQEKDDLIGTFAAPYEHLHIPV
jgi:hypothetical protein